MNLPPVPGFLFTLLFLLPSTGSIVDGAESTKAPPADEERFLDLVERRTFDYFWETTNEANGLVPDRWPKKSFSSIAAVGFGLTAYGVGVEREYITRSQAVERVLTTLRFFWQAPQGEQATGTTGHRGLYYHFLDMQTGLRHATNELSTIDTALLMAGVLFCHEYFDQDNPQEQEIRKLADDLFRRVEWNWMQPRDPLICMAWHPERGFGDHDYRGYNEAMLLYLLAIGSPTHAVDPAAWQAFTETYHWAPFHGHEHFNFGPLFGHQYSHVWIDFRGIADRPAREKRIDYFENSRRATLAQREYAIANPANWKGYGENIWGLTACDGPTDEKLEYQGEQRQFHSYWARGASDRYINDDGTIAPTAAGGSVPFAPTETIAALRAMHDRYGEHLFSQYGFRDSFNPSFTFTDVELNHGRVVEGAGWFNDDYLGIDQGPILLMIENYRTGFVWDVMRKNAVIRRGLERAGFTGGWIE